MAAQRDPGARTGILLPIAMAAGSAICFAFTDMLSKMLAADLPALEVAWARAVMSGILAGIMLGRSGLRTLSQVPRPVLGVLRGLFSAVIPALAVISLSLLPLALFTAILFMAPVLMTVLSVPLLGERVGLRRWTAVILGFAAVVIIVRPAGEGFGWAVALPLGLAVLNAFYLVLTRVTAPGMNAAALLAFGPGLAAVFLTLAMPFVWVAPTLDQALLLLGCGVVHAFSHLMVVTAFAAAPASVLAPFQYVQLPFAILAGYVAFAAVPALSTVIGGVLLIAAGVYIAYREHKLSRRGAAPR